MSTRFGVVVGNAYAGGSEFLGIPFAQPPVGALRWKPPVDPVPWTTPRPAQSFGPACPQMAFAQGQTTGTLEGDEDCLQLNVWTPQTATSSLPVLVFIHGGGHTQGSAGETRAGTRMYDGRHLAARGPAVVVTLQYRLGPLGYLVYPGLDAESPTGKSGNYGVLDEIQALHWVHDNIAAFGGDPAKVMVFGQSAGGVDTANLLTTTRAAGLFQRAAVESAPPVLGAYADVEAKGQAFVDGLVASGTPAQKVAALRAMDWRVLVGGETPPVDGGAVTMAWQPVIDGDVFTGTPSAVFASGRYNHVPLLIGSNADEMSLSSPPIVTPAMVSALAVATVPAGFVSQALALYPPGSNDAQARQSYVQLLTDAQFTSTVRRAARAVAASQAEPVRRYFVSYRQAPPLDAYGSYHGIELFYVFNTWEDTANSFTADDAAMQRLMMGYWVNFANTGDPNGSGLVDWPVLGGSADCYLDISATPDGSRCGLRTAQSDFWDAVAGVP